MGKVSILLIYFNILALLGNSTSDTSCSFSINNSTEKKSEFNTFINSGVQMIYVNIVFSDDELYTNKSKYDIKLENGLLRWIWTKNDLSFLLTFTEDIHAVSFNLLKGTYIDDITITVNMSPSECVFVYKNDTKSIFNLIHDNFMQNISDWQLCHRHFENQHWKVTLFNLTSYWLGYEMECLKPSCRTQISDCESIIAKSFINYIIIVFVICIFLYSPVLFYFFPEKVPMNNIKCRLENYNSFDLPYSISRLFLNLNKQPCKSRLFSYIFLFQFSQENQILTILVILSTVLSFFYRQININFTRDWDKYHQLYAQDDLQIAIFDNIQDSIQVRLLLIYLVAIGLLTVFISVQIYFLKRIKNVYFIYFLWTDSIVKYVDIDKLFGRDEQKRFDPHGYKIFVVAILNRIALLFSSNFYLSLMKPIFTKLEGSRCRRFWKSVALIPLCFINFILNICMCALPIIYFLFAPLIFMWFAVKANVFKKFMFLLLCVMNILSIVFVFRYIFVSALLIFIRFIIYNVFIIIPIYEISFKFWTLAITFFSYLRMFYKDFYAPYNELLMQCIYLSKKYNSYKMKIVSVKTFCRIADLIYPIRMQIAFLVGKILLLTFIMTIITNIMIYGVGGDSFLDQYLPLILLIVTPAVAMKLNSVNPKEEIKKYNVLIKEIMMSEIDEQGDVTDIDTEIDLSNNKCSCFLSLLSCCLSIYAMVFVVFFLSLKNCCSCECKVNDKDLEDKQFEIHFNETALIHSTNEDNSNEEHNVVQLSQIEIE